MSNLDLLLPLWGFIVVMVATPGPANLLLMSAGAQQGFLRTLPFIGGLVVGKLLLNLALALGLGQPSSDLRVPVGLRLMKSTQIRTNWVTTKVRREFL